MNSVVSKTQSLLLIPESALVAFTSLLPPFSGLPCLLLYFLSVHLKYSVLEVILALGTHKVPRRAPQAHSGPHCVPREWWPWLSLGVCVSKSRFRAQTTVTTFRSALHVMFEDQVFNLSFQSVSPDQACNSHSSSAQSHSLSKTTEFPLRTRADWMNQEIDGEFRTPRKAEEQ